MHVCTGALTLGLFARYRADAGLSLLPSPKLACTQITAAPTGPEHGYLLSTLCIVLVLVHEQPYCAKAHLFQPCQGQESVSCLSMVRSAHYGQTNGVKHAWARYELPSVSAP